MKNKYNKNNNKQQERWQKLKNYILKQALNMEHNLDIQILLMKILRN